MSILYDQMMDTVDIDELKQVFTDIFWMSHTYTFDSSELYPCRHGCSSVNSYKCTDVYKDYSNTNLKYDPFTVRKHDEYVDLGYEPDEDFRIVLPEGQCEVCGKSGAGCIWQENKVCYHGSGSISVASGEADANTIADVCFGEVGDTYKAEDLDDEFISDDDSKGSKIAKTDNKCRYYKEIKFCNTRKNYANQIKSTQEQLASAEESASKHSEKCNYQGDGECPTCKSNDEKIDKLNEKIDKLQSELDNHISTVCEKDETTSKFWCDGYKLCLGHKTHYTCPSHKLVCCFGHTNITVTIKILYKDELIDLAYKALN